MSTRTILMRLALALALAPLLWAPVGAAAQTNSRQATEAARKHRAETGQTDRASARSPAAPGRGLKSCMDRAGMDVVARDRCMRQHCTGRWGQGDCPASGGNLLDKQTSTSGTPLGRCLREAGDNPFKREGCGWNHCKGKRETSAECAAFYPPSGPPPAN